MEPPPQHTIPIVIHAATDSSPAQHTIEVTIPHGVFNPELIMQALRTKATLPKYWDVDQDLIMVVCIDSWTERSRAGEGVWDDVRAEDVMGVNVQIRDLSLVRGDTKDWVS